MIPQLEKRCEQLDRCLMGLFEAIEDAGSDLEADRLNDFALICIADFNAIYGELCLAEEGR